MRVNCYHRYVPLLMLSSITSDVSLFLSYLCLELHSTLRWSPSNHRFFPSETVFTEHCNNFLVWIRELRPVQSSNRTPEMSAQKGSPDRAVTFASRKLTHTCKETNKNSHETSLPICNSQQCQEKPAESAPTNPPPPGLLASSSLSPSWPPLRSPVARFQHMDHLPSCSGSLHQF